VVDEAEAEFFGDGLLEALDLLVTELDDFAGAHVDQVIVVLVRNRLVAAASGAKSWRAMTPASSNNLTVR
jgi:hypothetical protein